MFNIVSKVAAGPLKGELGTLLKAVPGMVNVQQGRNYAEHVIPDRLKVLLFLLSKCPFPMNSFLKMPTYIPIKWVLCRHLHLF